METKMGRPSKLTPDMQKKIVELIRQGNYLDTAAACQGVNRDSVFEWIKRGSRARRDDPDEQIYVDFSDAVKIAQAESEAMKQSMIAKTGLGMIPKTRTTTKTIKKDPTTGEDVITETVTETFHKGEWTALAWQLERHNRERYGRTEKIQHVGPNDGPMLFEDLKSMDPEQRRQRIAELQRLKAEREQG